MTVCRVIIIVSRAANPSSSSARPGPILRRRSSSSARPGPILWRRSSPSARPGSTLRRRSSLSARPGPILRRRSSPSARPGSALRRRSPPSERPGPILRRRSSPVLARRLSDSSSLVHSLLPCPVGQRPCFARQRRPCLARAAQQDRPLPGPRRLSPRSATLSSAQRTLSQAAARSLARRSSPLEGGYCHERPASQRAAKPPRQRAA
jgi:hypothetical protein